MWNPISIEPHVKPDKPRTVHRVLPPQHLLVRQVSTTPRELAVLTDAIRRQRAREHRRHEIEAFDDAIAFVFKHPHVQGDARFSRARPSEGTLYAAYRIVTALSERAFHQLRFYRDQGDHIDGKLIPVIQIAFDLTALPIVDLSVPPFAADLDLLSASTQYSYSQKFADAVRKTHALGIVYPSVRDPERGSNVALLSHRGLASRRLDRRRVRDWFMTLNPQANTALLQTTQGEATWFGFDAHGRPL
jgi:hypothetical protein